MPQSLVLIYVHIVFSTHERLPFLKQEEHKKDAFRILGGICNDLDCPVLRVGGVEDHVHIFCRLGKKIDVAELIKELKRMGKRINRDG
jgi:putative transposase